MASGIDIKMGVSGVAQFKQGMRESQAAVKSLDAQLKLNEAQLKASGDQEAYLQTKTELLNKQIEEQKKVVDQAAQALENMDRNGVSKTSTSFQNMQTQLYKAQTDLQNMQNSLDGVGESGEDAQSGVSHMNQALQRIGKNVSFENVVEGLSKITDGMEAAAKKAIELGKRMVQAMLSGGQWADDLQTTADKWEMSPEEVYRMQQTANMIDTSAENIFQARQKLIAAMGKESNKETMGAFAALGITNLTGTDENIEDVFWNAGKALMDMDDKVARNEYAMKLYGKSWTELIPIFKAGREEYDAWMASWEWVGDNQFQALTQLDDESNKTKSAWENIQHTMEAAMAPALTELMVALQGLMSEFTKYLQSDEGQDMLSKLNEAVTGLFSELTSIDPAEVIGKLTDIFEAIRNGFTWITEHKTEIFEALKYIAGGFALLKVTEVAASIGRIVNGLAGLRLFGGGGKTGGTGGTEATTSGTTGGTGSFWAGVVNKMTLAAGAYAVNKATEGRIREVSEAFKALTAGKTNQEKSDIAYAQMLGMNADEYSAFMANKPVQKTNGSQYYGQDWRPSYMTDLENPLNKMTEVAGEMGKAANGSAQANSDMTAAANGLMNVPSEIYTQVYNAILAGMSNVTIVVDASCVDTIGERISYGWGGQVTAEIQ